MVRINRLIKSFIYAYKGLRKTFLEEQNLQIQSLIAVLVIVLAGLLQVSRWEWCLLIFAISLVILMELANSAVERVTDVLKPRINGYVKEIKDIMAAAVFLASVMSIIIGIIIFWPYLV